MAKQDKKRSGVKRKTKKNLVAVVELPIKKEDKVAVLYRIYSQEAIGKHSERIAQLMDLSGLGRAILYRYAKEGDWEVKLAEELKETELVQHSEAVVQNKMSDSLGHVSFEEIATDIKGFASLAIKATKSTVVTAAKMMMYWTSRMENLVDTRGGIAHLTESDNIRMHTYEDRVLYYQKLVSDFIKPSAVVRYLSLVGMKESLQIIPDGNELGTLTPAALCKMLEEMGVSLTLGDYEAADVVEGEIAELGVDVPDLNGVNYIPERNSDSES